MNRRRARILGLLLAALLLLGCCALLGAAGRPDEGYQQTATVIFEE